MGGMITNEKIEREKRWLSSFFNSVTDKELTNCAKELVIAFSKKDTEWELRANKRVFETKMLKNVEIKKLHNQIDDQEEQRQELKSKLEEKEKEITKTIKSYEKSALSFLKEHGFNSLTNVILKYDKIQQQLQNSIPKSKVKNVLRNICKHKNIDTENCQVCEAYFQLFEIRG